MQREEMAPEMKHMCDCFEVSCVGCPFGVLGKCTKEQFTFDEAVKVTKDWYDGKYYTSKYNK